MGAKSRMLLSHIYFLAEQQVLSQAIAQSMNSRSSGDETHRSLKKMTCEPDLIIRISSTYNVYMLA